MARRWRRRPSRHESPSPRRHSPRFLLAGAPERASNATPEKHHHRTPRRRCRRRPRRAENRLPHAIGAPVRYRFRHPARPSGRVGRAAGSVVRIWQRARQFDPTRADADAWLAAAVRHAALNIARARGREAADDARSNAGTVDPDFLDALATTETGTRLRDALGKLEPNARAALVLGFAHGLSCAELSTRLSEPPNTVRTWLRRGLATLREGLA